MTNSFDTEEALDVSAAVFEKGYGWRSRIGMLVPGAVDETISRQFYRMAPPGVTLAKASLGVRNVTPDEIGEAILKAQGQTLELARRNVGCIILGGSPTVIVGGPGSEDELIGRIAEVTDIPVATAQGAGIEAMRSLGMERIVVATPFDDVFNPLLKTYLEAMGFTVAAIEHLGMEYRHLLAAPVRLGYELGKRCFEQAGGADGIYFPGAPFPIVDAIEKLEIELSTTVVSSLQASLWKGLALTGASDVKIEGFGALLRGS